MLYRQFFDLRVLFLITALIPSTRRTLARDMDAARVLYDILHVYLEDGEDIRLPLHDYDYAERKISNDAADIISEVMKIIYNLITTLERINPTDVRFIIFKHGPK